jgi:hypothetical protein
MIAVLHVDLVGPGIPGQKHEHCRKEGSANCHAKTLAQSAP